MRDCCLRTSGQFPTAYITTYKGYLFALMMSMPLLYQTFSLNLDFNYASSIQKQFPCTNIMQLRANQYLLLLLIDAYLDEGKEILSSYSLASFLIDDIHHLRSANLSLHYRGDHIQWQLISYFTSFQFFIIVYVYSYSII